MIQAWKSEQGLLAGPQPPDPKKILDDIGLATATEEAARWTASANQRAADEWLGLVRQAWLNRKSNSSVEIPPKPKRQSWAWVQGYGIMPTIASDDLPIQIPADILDEMKPPATDASSIDDLVGGPILDAKGNAIPGEFYVSSRFEHVEKAPEVYIARPSGRVFQLIGSPFGRHWKEIK
jgi:hypothetical protein